MRRGFQPETKIKPTKGNIKELITEEKRKVEENKRTIQTLLARDQTTSALLRQQAAQSHTLWHDIEDIKNGRISRPELLALRNQIRDVFLEGVRTNAITNVSDLANLRDGELQRFMNLLKDKRSGVQLNFIETLPFFKYEKNSDKAQCKKLDGQVCSVCHESYEEGVECLQLVCKHVFHRSCIIKWLKLKRNCPLCKQEITRPPTRVEDDENIANNGNIFRRN